WYFIPIASLWKPFQALREIWKASVDPVHWQSIPTNPLLGWWWAGFLVSNILDQASFRMSTAAHGLRALHDARVVAMISDTTDIIAIVLARPHVRLSTGRPVSQYAGNEGCAGLAGAEPHA